MEALSNYNDYLPVDWQGIDTPDPRVELYNMYGDHVFESLEAFCDRMADQHGDDWIYILSR